MTAGQLLPGQSGYEFPAGGVFSVSIADPVKEELILNWLRSKQPGDVAVRTETVQGAPHLVLYVAKTEMGRELNDYLDSFKTNPFRKPTPKLAPLEQAADDFEYYLDSMPTTDWFEASDYENPEEMVAWAIEEVAEKNQVSPQALLAQVKKGNKWKKFLVDLRRAGFWTDSPKENRPFDI